MMTENTLQENLNQLLGQYNIRATASILEAEIKIVLAIPPNCTTHLEMVREQIVAQLSKNSLGPQKIVKIFKVFCEDDPIIDDITPAAPVTQADVRREIFRIPNRSFLSQKEIRQYICQGWFAVLQDW